VVRINVRLWWMSLIPYSDPCLGMWTVDPIDGTKGFLRGGQYAVCLSLIVNSQVVLGVIGCPNIQIHPTNSDEGRGCIFVAVRGQGAFQVISHGVSMIPLIALHRSPCLAPARLNSLTFLQRSHMSCNRKSRSTQIYH
jgi:3'(2'), 5'-bisphosphate nucleotidase